MESTKSRSSQPEDSPSTVGLLPVIGEHIVSTPDTCGGKPRIAGSRIRVKDVVVWHDRQGMTPSEIVSKWPTSPSLRSTPPWPTTTTTARR